MLSSFMGHDLLVHHNYYGLPQDSLEMATVSKRLLAIKVGKVEEYKGKSLDEINLDIGIMFFFSFMFSDCS